MLARRKKPGSKDAWHIVAAASNGAQVDSGLCEDGPESLQSFHTGSLSLARVLILYSIGSPQRGIVVRRERGVFYFLCIF